MTDLTENLPGMVGRHPLMLEVFRRVRLAVEHHRPVLAVGETGTGKELIARAVNRLGEPRGAPFEAVNCAALPEGLAEAELFGVEKGAYTGADARRPGAFTRAHGGTLFLDELDAMVVLLQTKLLRALQDRCYRPVGGGRVLRADFRLVVAVSRPLRALIAERRVRPDLAYRVRGVVVTLPSLRARRSDIIPLARAFLAGAKSLAPGAERLLEQHRWPGNVRELQHVMENLAALVARPVIAGSDVLHELETPAVVRGNRAALATLLMRHRMNASRAALDLGVPRSTVQRWLAEVGLSGSGRAGRPRGEAAAEIAHGQLETAHGRFSATWE